ncbi:hypothetical protein Tco_0393237 [Tanacetum coccineum]
MLEKSMYDSWVSRIHLFIKGKKHGRMILDSIDNGPLVCLTVEEDGHTRPKKYSKLAKAQQLQDDCDVQATNIILHGLSPDMYALVNHQEAAKDIWDKVKETIRMNALTRKWHSSLPWHPCFHLQTINSECLPIQEIRQPFKMEESQFNKFKEDKLRALLAKETKELLQIQGENMQLVNQEL